MQIFSSSLPSGYPSVSTPAGPAPESGVPTSTTDSVDLPLPPDGGKDAREKWIADMFELSNHEVARDNPSGFAEKKQKMLESPYAYFRGEDTAFNLDLAKFAPPDPHEPRISSPGDLHALNFGTYRSAQGNLVYDVNDFDEAVSSQPFSRDILRDATSWILASREAGHPASHQEEIAKAYVDAFVKQLKEFARHGGSHHFVINEKTAPDGPVKSLLAHLGKTDPAHWVDKFTTRGADGSYQFVKTDTVIPQPESLKDALVAASPQLQHANVVAVASKLDSGTASIGLPRYYLLEQPQDGSSPRILEVKQELRSALAGVPDVHVTTVANRSAQVADAAATLPAEPYPQLGSFLVAPAAVGAVSPDSGEASFLVRERPAAKSSFDLDTMKSHEMVSVAQVQGQLTAAYMARQPGVTEALEKFLDDHPHWAEEQVTRATAAAGRVDENFHAFKKD